MYGESARRSSVVAVQGGEKEGTLQFVEHRMLVIETRMISEYRSS